MKWSKQKALELRRLIEKASTSLSDDDAASGVELFPEFGVNITYKQGERVRYNNVLYKVLLEHTSSEEWTPELAPSLFVKILPGQSGTEIGEWTKPDSTNPYMKGDRVLFEGKTYESVIDNNVWSPSEYPAGWQEVT